jgi:hypothetical protein
VVRTCVECGASHTGRNFVTQCADPECAAWLCKYRPDPAFPWTASDPLHSHCANEHQREHTRVRQAREQAERQVEAEAAFRASPEGRLAVLESQAAELSERVAALEATRGKR